MRAILTMAALFAAAVGSFLFYQYRLAEHEPKDGPPAHQDSAPPTVAQPLDAPPALPTQMLWKVDPRWQAAESEGKPLLEEIRELYRWQEEEGGDPLRFRTEKKRLAEALGPLVQGLTALQAELADNPGASAVIEMRIREFSGAMSGVLR